jgi:glycosyltransferase involved in cell wall biosynthesis
VKAKQFLKARSLPKGVSKSTSNHKLAYFGRISKSKGLLELISIDKDLPHGISIDVYGPLEDLGLAYFENLLNINYCGSLKPEEVEKELKLYSAIVLPTSFNGEGHPGIIIESLMQGKPVLVSSWHYITEIIIDGYNGVLFNSIEATDLLEGIFRYTKMDYNKLCENALISSKQFDLEKNIDFLSLEIEKLSLSES